MYQMKCWIGKQKPNSKSRKNMKTFCRLMNRLTQRKTSAQQSVQLNFVFDWTLFEFVVTETNFVVGNNLMILSNEISLVPSTPCYRPILKVLRSYEVNQNQQPKSTSKKSAFLYVSYLQL